MVRLRVRASGDDGRADKAPPAEKRAAARARQRRLARRDAAAAGSRGATPPPPGERAPTPTNGGAPRDDATDGASAAALAAAHKEKLAQAVEEHGVGRELIEEWEVRLVARQTGSQVGHFDPQYVSPGGKRFRSRAEALRHLGLQESKPKLPK